VIMKKIPFDIKYRPEIESGKYKVMTAEGLNVRIICWDRNTTYWKIVGLVTSQAGNEVVFTYDENGKESDGCLHGYRNDLLILTDEPELTDFEKELIKIMVENGSPIGEDISKYTDEDIEYMHSYSKRLLRLARQELQPEIDAEINQAYKNSDEVQFRKGREDVLKDLPVWIPDQNYPQYPWDALEHGVLYHEGHRITLDDLWNKLPKEE